MAKNHFWKKFENSCARDFGGVGRFAANQGGALDFETPYAIGQCKTVVALVPTSRTVRRKGKVVLVRMAKKKPSYGIRDLQKWCAAVLAVTRRGTERALKWPVVCVKARRGAGMKSETLFCFAAVAAQEWMGETAKRFGAFDGSAKGATIETLTAAVEALGKTEPDAFGVVVTCKGRDSVVVVGRSRFLDTYAFKGKGKRAA